MLSVNQRKLSVNQKKLSVNQRKLSVIQRKLSVIQGTLVGLVDKQAVYGASRSTLNWLEILQAFFFAVAKRDKWFQNSYLATLYCHPLLEGTEMHVPPPFPVQ